VARPEDRTLLLDLPSANTRSGITFLASEYRRMAKTLCQWNDQQFSDDGVNEKIIPWNQLSTSLEVIEKRMAQAFYPGLAARFQHIINTAASSSLDPAVFDLFEDWNLHVAANDFCTGSRFVNPVDTDVSGDVFQALAMSFLNRPPCARTMETIIPGSIAQKIVTRAKQSNARGVIGFTLKFCDPYLARIPMIREALQKESIPFLMLEGDCTMGAMGQQQTRIEAFTEMLGV